MKNQTRPRSLLRNALSGLLLCAGLISPSQTNAVTVTSASVTESTLPGIFANWTAVRSLNTDMHQVFNGTNVTLLTATVVEGDRVTFSPDASLQIECYGWAPFSTTYSLPFGATGLDVAIATNMSPTYNQDFNFIVNVVYEVGGDIYLNSYTVNNVGLASPPTTSSLLTTTQLNTPSVSVCRNPHIDMSANSLFSTYSGNYYALSHFAVVWEQDMFPPYPKGIYGVVGFWGSTSPGTPASYQSAATLIAAGDYSYPDVACVGYITPPTTIMGPSRKIYVSCLDNNNNGEVLLTEFEAEKTIVITSGMTTSVVAPGRSASEFHYNPRIESIVAADLGGFSQEIWQIVCESDPGTGLREVRAYNNMTSPTVPAAVYNLGSVVSFTGNHSMPVVSGVGEGCHPGAKNIFSHNKHFTTSYYSEYTNVGGGGGSNEGDYFANAIYQLTGLPAPLGPYPDYYEINFNVLQNSFVSTTNTPIIATSSSSNTGYELYSVWYEGWDGTSSATCGAIKYKFNSDAYAYKNGTTGINNINTERDYVVYPSPATTTINVKGAVKASYRIMDAIGKTISTGTLKSNANSINVSNLATGNYSIAISENEHTQNVRFVKL